MTQLGPLSDYVCGETLKQWRICNKPDTSLFKPMSTQDIMGQVFAMNLAFYMPENNITKAQFEVFDYIMTAVSGFPPAWLYGSWEDWNALGNARYNMSDTVSTVGGVMTELMKEYNPLLKITIELEDGCARKDNLFDTKLRALPTGQFSM